ncbi:hypothetical protein JCM10213_008934 [Rhodosporidiobolus nylandii]
MSSAPPAYAPSAPPAGLRIPCSTHSAPPSLDLSGPPAFTDKDGSPVWVASAIVGTTAVHPCKVARGIPMYGYGGGERHHTGRYDILPITHEMEWVDASYGQIPKGRRPVEGGFEEDGKHLFHALATIDGVQVPGKAGEHLHGANFGYGNQEHQFEAGYKVLCWR